MKEFIKKIVPSNFLDFYHYFLAVFAVFFYRFPSRKVKVIGITGTNGKTTTAHLVAEILQNSGHKTALISSIKFKIGDKEWKNILKMTMPGRLKLQKFLRQAVNANCEYMVLEVTSEGIKQFRHKFIDFDCVVFTNLTPEHIERHGSFEAYKKAKGKLFQTLSDLNHKTISIVNLDDNVAGYFLGFSADEKWGYSAENSKYKIQNSNIKNVVAKKREVSPNKIKFFVNNVEFNLNLLGEFNIYNALCAICIALSQGIDLEICQKILGQTKGIFGRMEVVVKNPFTIIVDYAHTPDAFEKVYKTVSQVLSNNNFKIIGVFGSCGGGRDKWKRKEIAKIAEKYCDEIILTNEDPYDEDPEEILNEIFSGFSDARNLKISKILDRKQAIKQAVKIAKPDDIVVITGKGCEPWMRVANNKKIPWDDREIVKQEFNKLLK
ncbi:MAG: UDP-N-acetylmuramoyl-L-alanyl-D-glutamate--2,6-diaminopimelate ligase [Patescibacteria group bacterium]|nr:UDP-N-acetylmuramoyl-L-alanyl-D-glutamate--2,6-diaminopimelate ligase [Patescibacteria group bacterium]